MMDYPGVPRATLSRSEALLAERRQTQRLLSACLFPFSNSESNCCIQGNALILIRSISDSAIWHPSRIAVDEKERFVGTLRATMENGANSADSLSRLQRFPDVSPQCVGKET